MPPPRSYVLHAELPPPVTMVVTSRLPAPRQGRYFPLSELREAAWRGRRCCMFAAVAIDSAAFVRRVMRSPDSRDYLPRERYLTAARRASFLRLHFVEHIRQEPKRNSTPTTTARPPPSCSCRYRGLFTCRRCRIDFFSMSCLRMSSARPPRRFFLPPRPLPAMFGRTYAFHSAIVTARSSLSLAARRRRVSSAPAYHTMSSPAAAIV